MANCIIEQNSLIDDSLLNNLDINKSLATNSNDQALRQISSQKNYKFNELTKLKNILQKFPPKPLNLLNCKFNLFYLIFFSFLLIFIITDKWKAYKRKSMALQDYKYQIEIINYNTSYDINNDSTMNVTENITISYQGVANTGFRRLIPVNNGVQLRNIRIGQIKEKRIEKVFYKVYVENNENLVLDIGDDQLKYGKNETYSITYEFRILNKIIEKENIIPLNVIGHEWRCKISNAFVQLAVPTGFTEAQCYVGPYGTDEAYNKFNVIEKDGKQTILASFDSLNEFEGVTFILHFKLNSVKSYVDHYCAYYIKKTVVVLIIIIIISLFAYYKNKVCPSRFTYAFNTIDPLVMSKILNGRVKRSDVTSIIFYWASKDLLDIDLEDENDPILIKKVDSIPDSFPSYQKYLFDELFKNGETVKTSNLRLKFYKTINKVIRMIDSQTNTFVNNYSLVLSLFLALLASIFPFIAPVNVTKHVSNEFEYSFPNIVLVFFQVIIWFIRYNMIYKYIINVDYIVHWIIIGVMCAFGCFLYAALVPSLLIDNTAKFALSISSIACVITSVSVIIKTTYFKAKINEVFGFKKFIEHPANEEFDSFLAKDPELFYNLLCYAQVLELTDKWKHKFDALTVSPPQWIRYSDSRHLYYSDSFLVYHLINRSRTKMYDNLVYSPSEEHSRKNHSGYSSHSHGGGGFGGGGGYGR